MYEACDLHSYHRPTPAYLQVHHVLPKSWGGNDLPTNEARLCGTGHDNVHYALNLIVKCKGPENVPGSLRVALGACWNLAVRAWGEHNGPTPYTASGVLNAASQMAIEFALASELSTLEGD